MRPWAYLLLLGPGLCLRALPAQAAPGRIALAETAGLGLGIETTLGAAGIPALSTGSRGAGRTPAETGLRLARLEGGAEGRSAGNSRDGVDAEHRRDLKLMGLSILLPGLAQWEQGDRTRATGFFVVEGGIWTSFAVFRIQGHLRKNSYVEMAQIYAGVQNASGRSDDYYRLLGSWPSAYYYDEYVIAPAARALYPNDLDGRARYLAEHSIPADEAWSWQTAAAWTRYQAKRSASQQAYHNAGNMLGLALANRLVALLDATLIGRNREQPGALHLEMTSGASGPSSAELRLHYSIP